MSAGPSECSKLQKILSKLSELEFSPDLSDELVRKARRLQSTGSPASGLSEPRIFMIASTGERTRRGNRGNEGFSSRVNLTLTSTLPAVLKPVFE